MDQSSPRGKDTVSSPVRAAAAATEPPVGPGPTVPPSSPTSEGSADGLVRQWAVQHRGAGQTAGRVTVSQRAGRVEVRGADVAQVERALTLTRRFEVVVTTRGVRARTALVELFTELGSTLPAPSVLQARRAAEHRRQLLASGYFTHETLGELRHAMLASSTRTWVSRQRGDHRLFTVSHHRQTVIPAFLFTDDGVLRDELQPLIAELHAAGISPWQAWTWLVSTSPLLSGAIPEQVARVEPARARTAARRFAVRLHPAPAA